MLPSVLAGQLQEGISDYLKTTFPMSNYAFKDTLRGAGIDLGGKACRSKQGIPIVNSWFDGKDHDIVITSVQCVNLMEKGAVKS